MNEKQIQLDMGEIATRRSNMLHTMSTNDAMRIVIGYANLREECTQRIKCEGCPYSECDSMGRQMCDKISTDDILDICATVFARHLLGM